ncbi:MAG: Gfo/Idh/MocA family oxidoreductase [Saprospiraceae bacterium]|nr:Gfo/Idh/MocA family oxidoreductase [Saprospiraceae bacterium]
MKRRKFIIDSGAAVAGFTIIPRSVMGGQGFIAPSDKLNIAAIGVGGKGAVNIANSYNGGTDNIVALCDVDDRMAVEARKQFHKSPYYRDYREMLDKEGEHIDAVLVSTPDHMHGVQALAAMKRGKHIYCEKPLTHDIYEARLLTRAAEKYQLVSQMGNQGSSGDSTRYIESWIQGGLLGDVDKVHVWTNRPVWPQGIPFPKMKHEVPEEVDWDLWLGTAPKRDFNSIYIPANWRGWVDFGTGALGDMGCHFMDVPFRALKLGYPSSAYCSASLKWKGFFDIDNSMDSYPAATKIHIRFPAREGMVPVEVIWYDGGIQPDRPPELLPDESLGEYDGGILFEGSQGKMLAGLFGTNPTILPTSKMKYIQMPEPSKAMVAGGEEGHQQQWVKACKEGFGAYTSSSFGESGPLTETVLMGNLAVLSYNYAEAVSSWYKWSYPGRKELLWDGENMKITNFEPANRFVRRQYRGDWDFDL